MIIYGRNASKIGELNIQNSTCPHCENTGTQHISVFGKYAHIYWIPFFPLGKEVVAECVHCKRTISQKDFPSSLKNKYEDHKNQIKRPIWHWAGVGVIAALVLLFNIINATTVPDPREKLLDADIERITTDPTTTSDSVAFKLKSLFNEFASAEVNPAEFGFLTKTKNDKVLILAKIPSLKQVQKEGREQVIELIELVAKSTESIKGKKMYIGVHGKYTMMMVKTPTVYENSNLVLDDPLYDFYGPKPSTKK